MMHNVSYVFSTCARDRVRHVIHKVDSFRGGKLYVLSLTTQCGLRYPFSGDDWYASYDAPLGMFRISGTHGESR